MALAWEPARKQSQVGSSKVNLWKFLNIGHVLFLNYIIRLLNIQKYTYTHICDASFLAVLAMPTTFNKKIVLSLQKERSNIIKTYKQMMWDFEQIK